MTHANAVHFVQSGPMALDARIKVRWLESAITKILLLCALISVITTFAIIGILSFETVQFFADVGILEFIGGLTWAPLFEPRSFGVVPLLCGTFLVSVGACLIAIPLGLGVAIFLAEFASHALRRVLKPIIEILAGIPSVVYGYFAVTVVTPALQSILPQTEVFNGASASIVLGFMVLPTIASLSDDALRAVPRAQKEGGFALGATKSEVICGILLPGAASGLWAAIILGFSRAIGETMAVTLAAGSTPTLTLNPLVSVQTMTSYIVQVSLGDTPQGSLEYRSLFAVAALLFLLTFALNWVSHVVVRRFGRAID